MSDRSYWSFDERHPLTDGHANLSSRFCRLFDRIDDAITAWQSHLEYLRIKRSTGA